MSRRFDADASRQDRQRLDQDRRYKEIEYDRLVTRENRINKVTKSSLAQQLAVHLGCMPFLSL